MLKSLYKSDMPNTIQLVELGPGRGSLMNDLLRVWAKNREMSNTNTFVYLVESSPHLRKLQKSLLCEKTSIIEEEPQLNQPYKSKHSPTINIVWLRDLVELPKKEAIHFLMANEFFDALPFQKFQVSSFI